MQDNLGLPLLGSLPAYSEGKSSDHFISDCDDTRKREGAGLGGDRLHNMLKAFASNLTSHSPLAIPVGSCCRTATGQIVMVDEMRMGTRGA